MNVQPRYKSTGNRYTRTAAEGRQAPITPAGRRPARVPHRACRAPISRNRCRTGTTQRRRCAGHAFSLGVTAATPLPSLWPVTALRGGNADNPVPVTGIAVEIVTRAQDGLRRFEIRLDPPELGRIDVRLDVDSSGKVTSR